MPTMFSADSSEGGGVPNETWQGLAHPALIPISEGLQEPTDKGGAEHVRRHLRWYLGLKLETRYFFGSLT